MKLEDARRLIADTAGYRVHFEKRAGGMLASDYFPERNEPAIKSLEDAWTLAGQWAGVDPDIYVNIYVVYAHDWTPVSNYNLKKLNQYPSVLEGAL